jgi:hypothetical protein
MDKSRQWVASKGIYHYTEIPDVFKSLPPLVYELQFDNFSGSFVLEKICDKFELPEIMYNLEDTLIKRVLKTFESYNKNFGILLKGLKGTGKTIAAKVICNTLNLPVILITKPWNDMGNFVNSIQQDIVLFFDEFEKTYSFYESFRGESNDEREEIESQNQNNSSPKDVTNLLTLMDGVFTSKYKRLFLLTTNRDYLPDALIARPSRIRYIKEFNDLPLPVILQILDNSVHNKELIPGLIDLLKNLEIITVDIVKAIAEEANLFNTAEPEFFEIFNVKRVHNHYDLYEIDTKRRENVIIENKFFDVIMHFRKGYNLHNDEGEYIGTIQKHNPETKELTVVLQTAGRAGGGIAKPEIKTMYYRKTIIPHFAFSHYV